MTALRSLLALAFPLALIPSRAHGAQDAAPKPATNVLLVTVDALNADRLGCYGFADAHTPAIDALAARGVLFERAYANCPLTLPAHASLLSGRTPLEHGVHDEATQALPAGVPTIAESFRASGYHTAAFVSALELDDLFGLSRGFERYDDDLGPPDDLKEVKRTRHATEAARAAARWIASQGEGPFFCWVQFGDPAAPYQPPYDAKQIVDDPYQGELVQVDAGLAALLDALRAKGCEENTWVVFVGSSGEALGAHGEEGHGALLSEACVRIPLLVALPGRVRAGAASKSLVGQSDLAPTLAELSKIAPPAGASGRSFAAELGPDAAPTADGDRAVYLETELCARRFGWSALRGLVKGTWKYVSSSQPALYDLAADPGETTNLVEREAARAAELAAALEALVRAGREHAAGPARVTGPPVQALAAIDAEPLAAGTSDAPREAKGVDPSQRMDSVNAFRAALEAFWKGDPRVIAAPLERAVAASPDTANLHVALAIAYERSRRFEDSVKELDLAMELDPESAVAQYYMGRMQVQTGHPEMAEPFYQRAAELAPDSLRAQQAMALRLGQEGRMADAMPYLRRVVALEPLQVMNWQRYVSALSDSHAWAELVRACGEAAQHFPDDLYFPNYQAWLLATAPDEAARDPKRALELARALAERTEMQDPGIVDTLAAALAATGDFDEAQAVLSKAILVVHERKLDSMLEAMRARLALYANHKPYVLSESSALQGARSSR